MKNIFVAVDGSDASQEALDRSVEIARCSGALLTGIFVMDSKWPDYIGNDWQSSSGSRQTFLNYIHEEQEAQARAAQEQFQKSAKKLKKIKFELRTGDPADVLIELGNNLQTDLLILSRRVFQVSGRPSLRSLAKKLVSRASRPVMIF